jgi:hypothetical protein
MSADTPPDVEDRYARLIMARTPARRVAMCFEMSASARAMVLRSLEQAGLVGDQLADALVDRLYGAELSSEALAACQQRVRRNLRGVVASIPAKK